MKQLLSLALVLLLGSAPVWAKEIKGEIKCGEQKLAKVVITDGTNFTTSNANGSFTLNTADDAEFVYIFTPSGYTADFSTGAPQFYQLLEGRTEFVFDLQKLKFDTTDFSLLAIADPQTKTDAHMNIFYAESLPDLVNSVAEYDAKRMNSIGITLGDIVHDNLPLFDGYKAGVASLGIPFYPVIGNHDHDEKISNDLESTAAYRRLFGPTDYGFNLGNHYYIVLDDIIYKGGRKYDNGFRDTQVEWLKNYLEYVPKGAYVHVAIHAPFFNTNLQSYIINAEEVLAVMKDYTVDFMSGHTHLNLNYPVADGVMEHNVGALCGEWWKYDGCQDGTPRGYQVFEAKENSYEWYYKSVGKDRYYQIELFNVGADPARANSVIAKIWNWDSDWNVEWYADTKYMGELSNYVSTDPGYKAYVQAKLDAGAKRVSKIVEKPFYFAAFPPAGTKLVKVVATDAFGNRYEQELKLSSLDVQGHRGCAGLMPENTIASMIEAVKLGVNTLELDLQITKDGEVIVAHDAHINPKFTLDAKGKEISSEAAEKLIFKNMKYAQIKKYNTGSKAYPRFPEQAKMATGIPTVSALIDSVEAFVADNGLDPIYYNIEIKSSEAKEAKGLTIDYKEFADKSMAVLLSKNLGERLLVQSFDVRCLNYIHAQYPDVAQAYLVENEKSFADNMAKLDFVPSAFSPYFPMVNAELVATCQAKNMKLVPWTVDKPEDIQRMLDLGVDGIISNYPNRVLRAVRRF
ncbi:MAG: glycerophosphodiester phosphodiesterase family protein [Mangrovibacterium sp.]